MRLSTISKIILMAVMSFFYLQFFYFVKAIVSLILKLRNCTETKGLDGLFNHKK